MARKAANRPTDEEILRTMYPDLPDSFDLKAKTDKEEAAKVTPGATEAKLAELQAKYSQLEGQLVASRTQRAPMQELRAPVAPALDLAQAPDPVVDPQGYANFVRAQTAAQIQYAKDQYNYEQTTARRQAQQMDDLWGDFNSRYADHATDAEKVEIATTRLLQRKQAEGVDINQYMYGNRDAFYRDIVTTHDRLFGKPVENDADADDEDEDDNRAVIAPGTTSGKPATGATVNNSAGSLSSEISAWQKQTGFYR